jgi:hypothetical protein
MDSKTKRGRVVAFPLVNRPTGVRLPQQTEIVQINDLRRAREIRLATGFIRLTTIAEGGAVGDLVVIKEASGRLVIARLAEKGKQHRWIIDYLGQEVSDVECIFGRIVAIDELDQP